MTDSIAYPMHMWRDGLHLFRQGSGTTTQGATSSKDNTLMVDATLRAVEDKCSDNASTCSFGVLNRYLRAVRGCIELEMGDNDDGYPAQQQPQGEVVALRTPGNKHSTLSVDDFVCTLLSLVDMQQDHRTAMTINEFGDILACLSAYVLPLVPQVTYTPGGGRLVSREDNAHIHMHEQGIRQQVRHSPNYYVPKMSLAGLHEDFVVENLEIPDVLKTFISKNVFEPLGEKVTGYFGSVKKLVKEPLAQVAIAFLLRNQIEKWLGVVLKPLDYTIYGLLMTSLQKRHPDWSAHKHMSVAIGMVMMGRFLPETLVNDSMFSAVALSGVGLDGANWSKWSKLWNWQRGGDKASLSPEDIDDVVDDSLLPVAEVVHDGLMTSLASVVHVLWLRLTSESLNLSLASLKMARQIKGDEGKALFGLVVLETLNNNPKLELPSEAAAEAPVVEDESQKAVITEIQELDGFPTVEGWNVWLKSIHDIITKGDIGGTQKETLVLRFRSALGVEEGWELPEWQAFNQNRKPAAADPEETPGPAPGKLATVASWMPKWPAWPWAKADGGDGVVENIEMRTAEQFTAMPSLKRPPSWADIIEKRLRT